jgi:hypothetical protein
MRFDLLDRGGDHNLFAFFFRITRRSESNPVRFSPAELINRRKKAKLVTFLFGTDAPVNNILSFHEKNRCKEANQGLLPGSTHRSHYGMVAGP